MEYYVWMYRSDGKGLQLMYDKLDLAKAIKLAQHIRKQGKRPHIEAIHG